MNEGAIKGNLAFPSVEKILRGRVIVMALSSSSTATNGLAPLTVFPTSARCEVRVGVKVVALFLAGCVRPRTDMVAGNRPSKGGGDKTIAKQLQNSCQGGAEGVALQGEGGGNDRSAGQNFRP